MSLRGRTVGLRRRRAEELGTKPRMGRQSAAYQGTVEAVFAILIAVGIGYLVDRYFETLPIFVLVGVVVGFSAFVLRLWRLGQELQPPLDQDSEGPRKNP